MIGVGSKITMPYIRPRLILFVFFQFQNKNDKYPPLFEPAGLFQSREVFLIEVSNGAAVGLGTRRWQAIVVISGFGELEKEIQFFSLVLNFDEQFWISIDIHI